MPRPLDESYESSSDDDDALRVDAAFAKAYSAREQKRLDARRAAGGDGVLDAGVASSSDSESSDADGAAALTPRVEADVLKTMAAIRRRDAAVYDGTTAFFADAPRARARAGAAEGAATTCKDLARARLAAGDAGADAGAGGAAPRHPHAYDAEQRALRQAMVEAGAGDADECALFHPKRAGGGGADDRAPVRAALDELRAAPAGDTLQDAFLADFVAGRRWAAPDALSPEAERDGDALLEAAAHVEHPRAELEVGERAVRDGGAARLEKRLPDAVSPEAERDGDADADADDDDDADAFEAAYNFRFESGPAAIATHARATPGSLRRTDDRRRAKREARRERKAADRRRKENELKRLRGLAAKEAAAVGVEAEAAAPGGFRYRAVPAADYGLSTDEILRTPDADLNRLVSVKRLAPYRDREFQVTADRRKRWRRDQAAREEARVAQKEAAKRRRKRARRKAARADAL